ncbi:hypothetical protein KNT92_gp057 [Klebsiella phage Mineola]|uniref:Uncharacterized protein n=1 Tax=Klebsiella phage Mineola TaxID=2234047 RepID=A0A2Z4QA54_9CAUD|nr:hypothetical protein KNT92_gp057 [Klebsiella phage Mineola]AWY06952.1 hypothetical protein CPT_Mineola_057 [Klebsiella phage Mineola]
MAEIDNISITVEGMGEFVIDSYMGVWFSNELMYWETHASMLNETHYESLYSSFMEMMHEVDESDWFELSLVEFKRIMEQLFQCYRIMKGEL